MLLNHRGPQGHEANIKPSLTQAFTRIWHEQSAEWSRTKHEHIQWREPMLAKDEWQNGTCLRTLKNGTDWQMNDPFSFQTGCRW